MKCCKLYVRNLNGHSRLGHQQILRNGDYVTCLCVRMPSMKVNLIPQTRTETPVSTWENDVLRNC